MKNKLERDLLLIFNTVPAMIFYKDKENNVIRVNKRMAEAVNKSVEEMEGSSCWNLFPKEDADRFWKDDKYVIETGKPIRDRLEKFHSNGDTKWARTDKLPYRDQNGNVIGVIGFSVDITDLISTQEKLVKTKKDLWSLFNYATFYVVVLDSEFKIKLCNYALAIALGFTNEDEPVGMKWDNFIPENYRTVMDRVHEAVCGGTGEYLEFTNDIVSKTGDVITVKWFNSTINNSEIGTFSVGVPLTRNISKEESIDSVRAYWRDVLNKDQSAIQVLKNMVFNGVEEKERE